MKLAALTLIPALLLGQPEVAARRPAPRAGNPAAALAKGSFLVAARRLEDPNFTETVVLLLAYGSGGAMGIVVNRPTPVKLATVLPDIEELEGREHRLHVGGPLSQGALLVLVRSPQRPADSEHVLEDVYVTSSRAVIRQALGEEGSGKRLRVYAGYAGWAPGQLAAEVGRGDWHVARGSADDVFSTSDPWRRLIERLDARWVRVLDAVDSSPGRPIVLTQGRVDHVGGIDRYREPGTETVPRAALRGLRAPIRPSTKS